MNTKNRLLNEKAKQEKPINRQNFQPKNFEILADLIQTINL